MKTTLLSLAVLASLFASSQPDDLATALMSTPAINVHEEQVPMGMGTSNALTDYVVADKDDLEKDFRSWLKNSKQVEGKKSGDFVSTQKLVVTSWSMDSIRVHYRVRKDGDGARLYLVVEKGSGAVSSTSDAETYSKIELDLKKYLVQFYQRQYEKVIAEQQKHFDRQTKDLEKLERKRDKIQSDLKSHEQSKANAEEGLRSTQGELEEADNRITEQQAQLEQDKAESEQAQKELEQGRSATQAKQKEFDAYNQKGELNTKAAVRVEKDLAKLKKNEEKLASRVTKAGEKITKTENTILKAEQQKQKLNSKIKDLETSRDKHDREISSRKNELDSNEKEIKDERDQIEHARRDLDRLRSALGGLPSF